MTPKGSEMIQAVDMEATVSKAREWAARLSQRANATALIRNTLGCGCSETVFHHYQIRLRASGEIPLVQMVMGDRLLLHLMDADERKELENIVPLLVLEGIEERDRRGLNRFRLVMVGRVPRVLAETFMDMAGSMDPKAHVHILPHLDFEWLDAGIWERLQRA